MIGYLAGPMTGYEFNNYPAFDKYAKIWRDLGHEIISPAELDRDAGVDEFRLGDQPVDLRGCAARDAAAICKADKVILIPGWEFSTGVGCELHLASILGLETVCADTGKSRPASEAWEYHQRPSPVTEKGPTLSMFDLGKTTPKIMLMGHGRHGKDTVAEILRDELGLSFSSSSLYCAQAFIYDTIKDLNGYTSFEECYEDRLNHRSLWAALIKSYNQKDPARLSREIFEEHDIYVGIRSDHEFQTAKEEELFDFAVWVDASEREPYESAESFNIDKSCADIVINNNGTEDELRRRLDQLVRVFGNH